MSYILHEVIPGAGAGDEGQPPRAHSIRGVAMPAAFLKNWSISKAVTRRLKSVFPLFILDIQSILDDYRS